MKTLTETKEG